MLPPVEPPLLEGEVALPPLPPLTLLPPVAVEPLLLLELVLLELVLLESVLLELVLPELLLSLSLADYSGSVTVTLVSPVTV